MKTKLFAGIDVAKNKHKVVVKNEEYEIVESFWVENNQRGFNKALSRIPVGTVVGLEATSEYHKTLVNFLKSKGYKVYVFNPRKTKNFAKINHIATKTDKVDAGMLADFIILGLHKTQKQWTNKYPELRQLTRARLNLIHDQNRYKLRVLNRLAVVFPEYEKLFSQNFGVTFTNLLAKYTYPGNFSVLDAQTLGKELISMSKGILRENKALEIIETARRSVGIRDKIAGYIEEIRTNIRYIQELEKDIKRFDRKIEEQMEGIDQKLTTIRGIDLSTAATIMAEAGDMEDFRGRRSFFNFTGIVPTIKESSKYKGKSRMSKHGSKYLRTAIWLGAISCINHNKAFQMYFIKKHHIDKKPKMVAVGAVCRKLTYNMYRIMKYNEPFEMEKALHITT